MTIFPILGNLTYICEWDWVGLDGMVIKVAGSLRAHLVPISFKDKKNTETHGEGEEIIIEFKKLTLVPSSSP